MKQLSNPPPRKRWWQYFDPRDVAIALAVLFICGTLLVNAYVHVYFPGPDIIVYMDKDAKQPAKLPLPTTMVVAGDRAVLWWSVFNKAIDNGAGSSDARYTANSAVDNVYGPPELEAFKKK